MTKWLEIALPADLQTELIAEGFDSYQEEEDRIILYLPVDDSDGLQRLRRLYPGLSVKERGEEEWADAWKQYYKPTPIGERLLIQPAWFPVENPGGRAVYLNDPGMAFGTGLHSSTRLCLEIMETRDLTGKRVLDIGCGSGILGLCALLLGAVSAAGVDIDPYAVRTAMENARLNGVENRFTAQTEDFLANGSADGFDVVFTNIIADIIIPLVPKIAPSGALWVASGIIENRLDDVLAVAGDAGLTAQTVRSEDGWAAILFAR